MNWSDERYVRIYTRDTKDLMAVGWEGRIVLYELLRKVDRAGVLEADGDLGFLAELLRIPSEIVKIGMQKLIERGVVTNRDGLFVLPNFVVAQEASQSDRKRQRESRAARRDRALRDSGSRSNGSIVTSGHERTANRDTGHNESDSCHSVPYRTVPSPLPPASGGSRTAQSAGAEPEPEPEPEEAVGRNGRGGPPRWSWEQEAALTTPDFVAPDEARALLAAVTSKLTGGKP